MKHGADPKRIAILVALTGTAAYLLYTNVFSSAPGTSGATVRAARTPMTEILPSSSPALSTGGRTSNRQRTMQEFHPSLKHKGTLDLSAVDPRLRLDLLEKVQSVQSLAAERSLFQYAEPPRSAENLREPPKVLVGKTPPGAVLPPAPTGPPGPPPAPPIPLKYYGYAAQRPDGRKRAFFLEGDDIFVAAEGDLVKRRYKIVRIGLNSVVVEDIQSNNTQTLPLTAEEPA